MEVNEAVFFKNGKEVEWIDPVYKLESTDKEIIVHSSQEYRVPRDSFDSYTVRRRDKDGEDKSSN